MSITIDGDLSKPTAVGTPLISYPVSNYQNLYFVDQEFVQLQSSFYKPTFGFNHHIYTGATFSEQTNMQSIGGGLLRFTWRFCHIPYVPLIETIYESVNFVGMKSGKYGYTEYVDYSYLTTDLSTGVSTTKTKHSLPVKRTAYNVTIREPFSRYVKCRKVTEFDNIAVGTAPAPEPVTRSYFDNNDQVTYMGTKYPASIDNAGNLRIATQNGEVVINPKDGQYNLPRPKPNVQPDYKDNFFEIDTPMLVYNKNTTLLHNQVKAQADANPVTTSNFWEKTKRLNGSQPVRIHRNTTNDFDFQDEYQHDVVVQYVDENTTPTLTEYRSYIGRTDMLVAPTLVEQFSGTIYTRTTITTTWL